jgi:hypothetical protein
MSQSPQAYVAQAQPGDSHWQVVYKIGAAAALLAVLFFRRNFGTELITFQGFGIIDVPATHPNSASGFITLLQDDPLLGLALLDLVELINYALVGLIFLALYAALRRSNSSAMALATSFGFVGIAVYFASNQAFSMLSLSHQYAAATTDAQKSLLLAAGEALLAIHNPGSTHQGTGIYTSLFLVLLAGLIISIVMLRSDVFGKATAWTGILANSFGLGHFIALLVAPTTPAILALPTVISAPFRVTWYVLTAVQLFQLESRRLDEKGEPNASR